jgi:hypothetical protein
MYDHDCFPSLLEKARGTAFALYFLVELCR